MNGHVIPQTAYHLPPAEQNHGKKRHRIGNSPDPQLRSRTKRVRSSAFDIRSLSAPQLATLSAAASILQVHPSALLNLAPKVQHKIIRPSERSRRASSEMARNRSYDGDPTPKAQFQSRLSIQNDHSSNAYSSNLAYENCNASSFGIGLVPKQIAECFANFTHSRPERVLETEYTDEGSAFLPMAYSNTHRQPDSMNSQYSSSLVAGTQTQSHTTSNFLDYYASGQPHTEFLCDELATVSSQWPYTAQTTPILDTQPFGTNHNMSYPSQIQMDRPLFLSNLNDLNSNPYVNDSTSFDQNESSDLIDLSTSETTLGSQDSESTDQSCVERSAPAPRRPFQDSSARKQTAETRKNIACIRCRMQRIRCNPDPLDPAGICLTCKKVIKPKMSKIPCVRYKLADVRLFREGSFAIGHEWSHRFSGKRMEPVTMWASSEVKTIYVTQDYGGTAIAFNVREFIPLEGDMLHRQWADGDLVKKVPIPNYAVIDMAAALQAHKDHIVNDGPKYFISALKKDDKLVWDTYSTAIFYSKAAQTEDERTLLQLVLQLWVTVRMCVKSQRISGPENLGMSSDLMDCSSPMHGKIPTPPVLSAQLQYIVTQKLQGPLRVKILDLLQKLTLAQKPSNWLSIYLCTFILLHNCSMLTEHDMGYARKHGIKRRHARLDMIKELHNGANVLLAHFHYACKGFSPFTLDWNPAETTAMAELDVKQIRFVRQTAVYVNFNELSFKKLLDEGTYYNEHYLIAQLYEKNWKPRSNI